MTKNVLPVKNMVCKRCILAVEEVLRQSAVPFEKVTTGEIHLAGNINQEQYDLLGANLKRIGLELIDNRMTGMIEKIKQLVIKKARNESGENENRMKLSAYLTVQLCHEYTYLSSLFSTVEGRTIENYFIEQRIEKVKELLLYKQMSLQDISFGMGYSSTAHLSSQFKKVTGRTVSQFKQAGISNRKMLDHV